MTYHFEKENGNTFALDLGASLALDELDEFVFTDSFLQSSRSRSQCNFFDDFDILTAADLLKGIDTEELNDLNNHASLDTEDESSVEEEEKSKGKKRKRSNLCFSDDIDIEEPFAKRLISNDFDIDHPSAKPKLKIISNRTRRIKPPMRVQLLKGLSVRKAKKYWRKKWKKYLKNGRGLCCNDHCWMAWKYIDVKQILIDW